MTSLGADIQGHLRGEVDVANSPYVGRDIAAKDSRDGTAAHAGYRCQQRTSDIGPERGGDCVALGHVDRAPSQCDPAVMMRAVESNMFVARRGVKNHLISIIVLPDALGL